MLLLYTPVQLRTNSWIHHYTIITAAAEHVAAPAPTTYTLSSLILPSTTGSVVSEQSSRDAGKA